MNRRSLLPLLSAALLAFAAAPVIAGDVHEGHDHAKPAATAPATATEAPGTHAAAAKAPPTPAEIGKPAPDFVLKGLDGKEVKLSNFSGKTVVLEWFNPDCPFIKHAHTKGDLKDQGNKLHDKGVVYLAINSSGPGLQGAGVDRNIAAQKEYGMKYPILIDETGSVGQQYGARTTPHIMVIDPAGTLVYRGAIDNAPFGEIAGGGEKINHLDRVLGMLADGKRIEPSETKSYGCSVKYAK